MKTLELACFVFFQFSTYFPGYFDGQYWLWWVFLVLGKSAKLLDCCYFAGFLNTHPLNFSFVQVSCCSCEDSSTMPEFAKWPTPYPRCPALESSSSIKLAVPIRAIEKEHRTGLTLFDVFWTNPWCEMVNGICKNITH